MYGILFGFLIAFLARKFLRHFEFSTPGFDMTFMVALALVSYALPSLIGGNGYMSTYIVGIILGNTKIKGKKSMVNFFDGITGLMQMLIFFLLGLLATPSKLPEIFFTALFIALFLIYILTSLMADKAVIRKVWLAAFLVSFVVTAVAVSFLRFSNQEVMMNATELSWYYILYLFASLMVVLGVINLWMFRKQVWKTLFAKTSGKDDDEGEEDDE